MLFNKARNAAASCISLAAVKTQKHSIRIHVPSSTTSFAKVKPVNLLRRRYSTSTNDSNKFFITTPIYYVNGVPHIGHLYSSLLADAIARYQRLKDPQVQVLFSTGTDEHGNKVDKKAIESKLPTIQYCDQISQTFKQLFELYDIGFTDFIRTTEKRHEKVVRRVWNELLSKGQLYEGHYAGWYCHNDEAFVVDVVKDEKNPNLMLSKESGQPCEWLTEKNFKFKLTQYFDQVEKWLLDNPDVIIPSERHNEVMEILARYKRSLQESPNENMDLSVSRSKDRVKWGIPVPGHEGEQVMYVWLDALTNYITVAQEKGETSPLQTSVWPPDVQIIGKDILKFHAIYWPAFLLALGLPLPKKLIVHSHWTVDHIKMSKSRGNVQCPFELAKKYETIDGIRFYFLSEGQMLDDSNFSKEQMPSTINLLADWMGNVLTRTFSQKLSQPMYGQTVNLFELNESDRQLIQFMNESLQEAMQHYQVHDFRNGIAKIMRVLQKGNIWFNEHKPWVIGSDIKASADDEQKVKILNERLQTMKYIIVELLRNCGIGLYPVMPRKMKQMLCGWMGLNEETDLNVAKLGFNKQWPNGKIECITQNLTSEAPPALFSKIKKV